MATPRRQSSDLDCIPGDSVDRLLSDWDRSRPALDFSPVGVMARLQRVRGHFDAELDGLYGEYGLTPANFAVLVTLARLDEPRGVSQRRLMVELGLTSGTVSVRMDRLVEMGLVDRHPDPGDGRNTLITLSQSGRDLFERVVPAHLDNEARLLSALSAQERGLLQSLLSKLLVEFEGSLPPEGAAYRLGLTLAPAHVTIAMRRAVGLSADPGLLVRDVSEDGPADHAGMLPGDVVTSVGSREARSIAALYAGIEDANEAVDLTILRGAEEINVSVDLAKATSSSSARLAATPGRTARGEHNL